MTMAFGTLAFTELAHSLNVRSMDKSLFTIGFFTNKALTLAILGSALLQVAVMTLPVVKTWFSIEPMTAIQWAIVAGLSLSIIPIVEIQKVIMRAFKKNK